MELKTWRFDVTVNDVVTVYAPDKAKAKEVFRGLADEVYSRPKEVDQRSAHYPEPQEVGTVG